MSMVWAVKHGSRLRYPQLWQTGAAILSQQTQRAEIEAIGIMALTKRL